MPPSQRQVSPNRIKNPEAERLNGWRCYLCPLRRQTSSTLSVIDAAFSAIPAPTFRCHHPRVRDGRHLGKYSRGSRRRWLTLSVTETSLALDPKDQSGSLPLQERAQEKLPVGVDAPKTKISTWGRRSLR